jgi:hypothetical protein
MDKPRTVPARLEDLLNAIFFAEGLHALDVLDLHAFFGSRCERGWHRGTAERTAWRSRTGGCPGDRARWPSPGVKPVKPRSAACLKHQPVETREYADDLLRLPLDQVHHPPTISPTVPLDLFLGFGYAWVVRSPDDSLQKGKNLESGQNPPLSPLCEAQIRMTKACLFSRPRVK